MDHPMMLQDTPSILLTLKLTKVGTNRINYDGQRAMHRLMLAVGTIDATGRPPFHGVDARVQFDSPVYFWEAGYGAGVPGGKRPPEVCGIVTIHAGLKEADGSTPVYARIGVPDPTLDAILANLDRALAAAKDVALHLVLDPLAPTRTDIEPHELDITQTRTYAVRNFQLMA